MPDERRTLPWIAVLVVASLGFSLGFACATPLAALGAVGALQLRLRDAVLAVLLAWLANQVIGFAILHYPPTLDAFAWGLAIGVAGTAGATAAAAASSLRSRSWLPRPWLRAGAAFMASFAAYEGALYAASFALSSGSHAYSTPIVLRIFAINTVAFVGLLVLQALAVGVGLLRASTPRPAALA